MKIVGRKNVPVGKTKSGKGLFGLCLFWQRSLTYNVPDHVILHLTTTLRPKMEAENKNRDNSKRRGAKFTCSDMLSVVTEMCNMRTKRSGLVKHYLKFGDKGLLNLGPLTTDIA